MTVNPFEQSTQQLLRFLTSHAEWEVIDYIRQEIQHDAPDSVPTADELLTFFRSPDAPTALDTCQQMLVTDKLLEYAEISLRTLCDLIRYQQLKNWASSIPQRSSFNSSIPPTRRTYHESISQQKLFYTAERNFFARSERR